MPMSDFTETLQGLTLPVIAAPMTKVSGPELVRAACEGGVLGSFPVHNARGEGDLDRWLSQLREELGEHWSRLIANVIVHRSNARLELDLEVLLRHRVPAVITSVGAPDEVVGPLHDAGITVLADVATLRHAERAIAAGVDGLVLLAAGAGGQTGSANPFAFVREVRRRFDGLVALAGGLMDGTAVLAARVAGADLAYLGTPFLATTESRASTGHKTAVVAGSMDDVRLTTAVSGIPSSVLATWLESAERVTDQEGRSPDGFDQEYLRHENFAWSAGHGVGAVTSTSSVDEVVTRLRDEYRAAVEHTLTRLTNLSGHHTRTSA